MILDHCYRKSITYSQNQIFSVDKWFRNKNKQKQQQTQTKNQQQQKTGLSADLRKRVGLEILHNSWVLVGSRLSDLREALVVGTPVVGTI